MEATEAPYIPLKNRAEAADFNRKRRHNALRLKNRFADIIDRYSHDFSDVADVIDLETEKLVVDNGHLENMSGELDPAYDPIWDETYSEEEDVEVIENEEDIDELCSDMMTEKEKAIAKGLELPTTNESQPKTNENQRGSPSRVVQGHNGAETLFPEEELALVPASPSNLVPTIGQNVFQAPMFPQLENAVNSMTSMLQQQMMAMLGAVLPAHSAQGFLPVQPPQVTPESRQLFPAAPQPSHDGQFATLTPSPTTVSRKRNRAYTQSTDSQIPSPKIHSLKRRRMSDTGKRGEVQSLSTQGRKLHSTYIERGDSGMMPETTLEATSRRSPTAMPARSRRATLMQSVDVSGSRIKDEIKTPSTKPVSTISQLLLDDKSSEDELSPSFKPASTKMTPRLKATPKKTTSQRNTSPRVVIPPRPRIRVDEYVVFHNGTLTPVTSSPARKLKCKAEVLDLEKDSKGESLMPFLVDDLEGNSDFEPLQLPSTKTLPEMAAPEVNLKIKTKPKLEYSRAHKYACNSGFEQNPVIFPPPGPLSLKQK